MVVLVAVAERERAVVAVVMAVEVVAMVVATVEVTVVALEVVAKPRTATAVVRVAATRAIARVAVAATLAATVERFRVRGVTMWMEVPVAMKLVRPEAVSAAVWLFARCDG